MSQDLNLSLWVLQILVVVFLPCLCVHLNDSSNVRMFTSVVGRVCIVDSGSIDHMTSNKNFLFDITPPHVPYLVSLPNGHKVKVTCIGSLTLLPFLTLHHLLYIPTFHFNLISVSKFIAQFNYFVLFTSYSCILLQVHSMKKLQELGRMEQGLYKFYLNHSTSPAHFISATIDNFASISNNVVHSTRQSSHVIFDANVSIFNTIAQVDEFLLNANVDVMNSLQTIVSLPSCNTHQSMNTNYIFWHHRPGHVPFLQMKNIPSISSSCHGLKSN